eukprot:1160628-Pelagomonas_calceolata.AAC.16
MFRYSPEHAGTAPPSPQSCVLIHAPALIATVFRYLPEHAGTAPPSPQSYGLLAGARTGEPQRTNAHTDKQHELMCMTLLPHTTEFSHYFLKAGERMPCLPFYTPVGSPYCCTGHMAGCL